MLSNKQVVLNSYVEGYPKETDFSMRSSSIAPDLPLAVHGAVLVKNLYLACDAYLRHRMSKHVSNPGTLVNSFSPGSVLTGYGVAKIIRSTNPDFKEGDFVWGITGWEEFSIVSNTKRLNKIEITDVPLSYYTGVLGMPGLSAYYGFFNMCSPKKGETVYVSTAAGGVGQLVGQLAKQMGCYVVGSASTNEKVRLVKTTLGFDDAFNYKEEQNLGETLRRFFPEGIDIYFDNVGGKILDEVLLQMKPYGRIAACGMISQYNLEEPDGVKNLFCMVTKRIEMKGFLETDLDHVYPQYLELAIKYIKEGKLVYVEDMAEGLENAAPALVGIFQGRNVGKQVVRVAPE